MGNITSKELPEEIRPYERCLKAGPQALNDAELLAVLLRTGSRGENSLELASRLLSLGSLADLGAMTVQELCAVRGVGRVKALQLQCAAEFGKRMGRGMLSTASLDTPEEIAGIYLPWLSEEKTESVILLLLNQKNRLIRELTISRGTINQSLLSPREVFLEALRYQAVKLVLLHNHPSGDPTPSEEDIIITDRIMQAGCLLMIPLIDHLIIGRGSFVSLKEMGYIQ